MGKLVRDKIPAMIKKSGEKPQIRILEEAEYRRCLEAKLDEEVAEFHAEQNVEELADILEVVLALTKADGRSENELFAICRAKRDARGGFDDKILLLQVDE